VTASGGAPRPPPGVVVSHRYAFGMAVEVAGEDEGFERSWYSGEVLKAAAKVTVRYDALFEEDSDAKRPLTETLEPGRLRPLPPKAQEGWLRKAKAGLPLELKHDGGWWQVEFVSVADGGDAETATQLLVRGAGELWGGAEILADVSSLRPGWHFNAASQSWGSRGAAAAAAPKKSRSGSKSRRSGARPDKGAA